MRFSVGFGDLAATSSLRCTGDARQRNQRTTNHERTSAQLHAGKPERPPDARQGRRHVLVTIRPHNPPRDEDTCILLVTCRSSRRAAS
ncbi:hypothetical protein AKJ09_08199 [Labilithrix luteola]|uniref:Uncharacterized protein n=1 Tax=Labilithrix luteola TaxID=1391654 RepID=A0A0K1Q6S7_9BACT|nr:hypothetical protein AKJ09_08199 [Labilithrix luteola]